MKLLAKISKLRTKRGRLYAKIWLDLLIVRLTLSWFGYKALEKSTAKLNVERGDVEPADIAQMVKRVSRFVPGALCLAQSIAAQRHIAKYGIPTTIRIGVKSDSKAHLSAHAWLIYRDRVILGGSEAELREYDVMTDMNSATVG